MRSRAGKGCTDSSLGRRFCHPLRPRTFLLKGAVSTKTKRTKERAPASVFSKTHAKSWTQVSQKVCDPTTQDRGLTLPPEATALSTRQFTGGIFCRQDDWSRWHVPRRPFPVAIMCL